MKKDKYSFLGGKLFFATCVRDQQKEDFLVGKIVREDMAAMVNMNNLLNGKDSRWLQLEVCREFQRNKCSRPDTECKFAHPPANVEVQNGRVTACYDSIKVSSKFAFYSCYLSTKQY